MITDDIWLTFIGNFFDVDIEWINHVTKNWNHFKNETGCGCHYMPAKRKSEDGGINVYTLDSEYCTDWLRIKVAREQQALA